VNRTRRSLALIAAALTTGLVLTACGGPTKAGAAATVGDQRITNAELDSIVSRASAHSDVKAKVDQDKAGFRRDQLSQLITQIVLEKAAADKGIHITDGQIDEQIANYVEQSGGEDAFYEVAAKNAIAKEDVRAFIKADLIGQELGKQLAKDEKVEEVHAAHILVADKAKADEILAKVKADPSTFAALAKDNSTDDSNKDTGGDLGWADPNRYVKPFADAITNAADGTYLVVQTDFGWHVIHVIAKRQTPVSEIAEDSPSYQQAQAVMQEKLSAYLTEFSKSLHISVASRYGTWDPSQGRIVASKDDLSSPDPNSSPNG
jgi:parvulin-like peptidyl-prolyl isomerase